MFDLPEHLSSLNALSASPTNPIMDAAQEDAVWDYLNTDELFRNFGVQPSELAAKQEAEKKPASRHAPADLKSFVEQFANQPSTSYNLDYALNLPYTNPTTPAISTSDILPKNALASTSSELADDDDRPNGAKRLKQAGAGPTEIEEDKRRRNTEASARFRAKKKEREQNLERRAKELEAQVAQLQADKSSLENENKLLKAIVLAGNGGQPAQPDAIAQLVGGKRKRD